MSFIASMDNRRASLFYYPCCDLHILAKKLASRLATQRKSLRKFNLRPLAILTCRSVWPRLKTFSHHLRKKLYLKSDFRKINWLTSGFTQLCHWIGRLRTIVKIKSNERTSERAINLKKHVLKNRFISNYFMKAASSSLVKGPLKYLLMPLLGKNQLAITLHLYASIGPNLDNTHRGHI